MSEAQVHALEEQLRQEEDLLRVKEKELHARREALLLKQTRKESRGDSFRYKLQELEDEERKERALAEAFREAQQKFGALDPRSADSTASKEGQWLMRITALEDELRQKTEKVKALRSKEQELEAELRNRLHADSALLPALRLAASEMAAALQRHGPVAGPVEALQSLSVHLSSSEPLQSCPENPRPSVITVPPLPSCLAKEPDPASVPQSVRQGAEVAMGPSDTSPKGASTERTPVSSQRSSRGGSDPKERWTTPVRRLDASLPTEDLCPSCGANVPSDAIYCRRCGTRCKDAASVAAVKTELPAPLIQAKRLESVQGPAVSPLTLPVGALGVKTTSGTAASAAANTMGTMGNMGTMGTVAPATSSLTWRASSPPWTPWSPGYQPQVATVAGRMSLPIRTVAPVAQGTGLGFTPQTMPPMPGRSFT